MYKRQHPRQYSSYTADSDRAIAIAREQKTGEDMYAAQYHENFADLAFRAKDDMGGKTITLKSMTVEGIIAVSYTHLDVYKRQYWASKAPNICAAAKWKMLFFPAAASAGLWVLPK